MSRLAKVGLVLGTISVICQWIVAIYLVVNL